jgi:hypothetical protein
MKPIEILNIKKKDSPWELTHWEDYLSEESKGRYNLMKYLEQDCLVAYCKELLGTIFLLKGKREYFAYIIYNDKIKGGNLFRIKLNKAYKLLDNSDYITNITLWEDFTKRLLVKSLG